MARQPADELLVELSPAATARLRFFDRGQPVALDAYDSLGRLMDLEPPLRARHEDPRITVYALPDTATEAYELVAAAPGRVLLDVALPPGYLPLSALDVDLAFVPPRDVRVELERIPALR